AIAGAAGACGGAAAGSAVGPQPMLNIASAKAAGRPMLFNTIADSRSNERCTPGAAGQVLAQHSRSRTPRRPAGLQERQAEHPGAGLARPAPERPWNCHLGGTRDRRLGRMTSTRWLSVLRALPIGTPP
ncbi:hypothetical protein, partial [Xanthomonas translucens]|uniref:hypothetical protein n=1 Tax=Xanthomonas campestris pv. translucens TaxID=343 RepID=UPI0019D32A41